MVTTEINSLEGLSKFHPSVVPEKILHVHFIYKFVKYHDDDLANCRKAVFKKTVVDIGVKNFPNFIKLRYADSCAHNLSKSTQYAVDDIVRYNDKLDFLHSELIQYNKYNFQR